MTGVLPMFPERRKRQHAFVLEPILRGRNKLLLQITISPHLASPEGEGQIHLTAWLSMAYQIRSNLHLPVFDRTGVTCISPTGENERGLMFIGKVTPASG